MWGGRGVGEEGTLNVNRSASRYRSLEIDGRVTCHFVSFPTVFQSYQNDGMVIMKDFVQNNLFYG